jgi:hypothetical protein
MFRKLALALGATVVMGSAALIPTSASAHMHGHGHWGHGHGFGWGVGIYVPTTYVGSECYITKRVVETPVGPRVRRFTVCD